MTRTTIWTLILTLVLTSAAFAATDGEAGERRRAGDGTELGTSVGVQDR